MRRTQSRRQDTEAAATDDASPRWEIPCRSEQVAEALVQFLTEHVRQLMSPLADPVPPCPRCGASDAIKRGYQRLRNGRMPSYQCRSCDADFNRLSGSPLASRLFRDRIYDYIGLLPVPLSFREAARRLGTMELTVASVVRLFRRWLLELDPSGHHERSVCLGGRIAAQQALAPPPVENPVVQEDTELTATLLADFDHIHSKRVGMPPACPHCDGGARYCGHQGSFPGFKCLDCKRKFTRRTGTPFCRNRADSEPRQRKLIRYLALPLPTVQLAEVLDAEDSIAERFIREFRERCQQIDSSGQLVSRIQAGIRPSADTPCVHCGVRRAQLATSGPAHCGQCGRIISMRRPISERSGVLEVGPWEWSDRPV